MNGERPIVLTGIKPTGELHLGNYLGVIKPAIEAAEKGKSYFFVADLHALNQEKDPKKLSQYIRSVAAAWLASGLDPNKNIFYRQSDIKEIGELSVILSAVTAKGLMNKSHAYKAFRDRNVEAGKDPDSGINMGLFTYPILMAADILAMQAEIVPVGKDQVQHVEIARDIAEAFNKAYNGQYLTLPRYIIESEVSAVPGIDGRKMSKSYGNTIPLFTSPGNWRKVIKKIVTDSSPIGAIEHPEDSTVFKIYKSVAGHEESELLLTELRNGNARWGEAKDRLALAIESRFSSMNERYLEWMNSPDKIKQVFENGKKEAEPVARKTLESVKEAVGIGY